MSAILPIPRAIMQTNVDAWRSGEIDNTTALISTEILSLNEVEYPLRIHRLKTADYFKQEKNYSKSNWAIHYSRWDTEVVMFNKQDLLSIAEVIDMKTPKTQDEFLKLACCLIYTVALNLI